MRGYYLRNSLYGRMNDPETVPRKEKARAARQQANFIYYITQYRVKSIAPTSLS